MHNIPFDTRKELHSRLQWSPPAAACTALRFANILQKAKLLWHNIPFDTQELQCTAVDGALRQQPALIAAAIGTLHLLGFYLSTSPTSYLENIPTVGDPSTLPGKCAKVGPSTINSYLEKTLWVTC